MSAWAGKVRQITVLNLGRHFPVKQEDWPLLCLCLEQLLHLQDNFLPITCPEAIEGAAQRYAGQLIERALPPGPTATDTVTLSGAGRPVGAVTPERSAPDFQEVDIDSLQQTQPRTVGVEHLALHALSQLGFAQKLSALGINGTLRAAILGNVIGRLAEPASKRSTWNGLKPQSALGELIDVDFAGLSHMRLYRASVVLMRPAGSTLAGRIVAFINDAGTVKKIHDHIGESTQPPPSHHPATTHRPSAWATAVGGGSSGGTGWKRSSVGYVSPARTEIEFDQRIAW